LGGILGNLSTVSNDVLQVFGDGMTAPLVSIVIPAYRAARYLGETIASVRAQTHTQWELLICEDGVVDDTADQVRAFAATTPNPVRLWQNRINQGVSRTRNLLIDAAVGTYLAFLDADDLWPPAYLASALERLERSRADWQIVGVEFIDGDGGLLGRREIPPVIPFETIPTALLRHSYILPSAVVAHRRIFDHGLRFDSRFPIGEDVDLWIAIIRAGFRPLVVPEAGCKYRKHPEGATADVIRLPEEFSRVFERYLGDPIVDQRLCRGSICSMLTSVARMTWRRQPQRALAALGRLFQVSPWHLPAWPWFILAKASQARR